MSVITVNNENFEKEILQSRMPVLLDFWATWCGPCRMMSPVVDEIAESMNTSIKVGKINIDECPNLAEKYGVMSIPTLILFIDGAESGKLIGLQSKDDILDFINKK